MAFNFRSLASAIVTFFLAAPICAYPTFSLDDTPEPLPVNLTARQDVEPSAIHYTGWQGCDGPQQDAIRGAWKELLMLGKANNHDIDWTSEAAQDLLGAEHNNEEFQTEIQNILKNIVTWTDDGTFLSWQLEVRCDDYLRRSELSCPYITKPEDETKCHSRCWQAITFRNANGQIEVARWIPRAAAYTTNHNGVLVATINWCPSFFSLPTCVDQAAKTIAAYPAGSEDRLNLNNYQCRGYVALHELFHIDSMSHRVAYAVNHIYDRKIRVKNPVTGLLITVNAYGPQYTRTLARWTIRTGWWVVTNADNLAQYCLAMWATSGAGDYPRYPQVKDIDRPVTSPSSFGVDNDNGVISLIDDPTGDLLGPLLNVAPEDAYDAFAAGELSCSDAGWDNSTTDPWVDPCDGDPDNTDIDLDSSPINSSPTTTAVPVPVPTTTSAPQPTDFNCNCGEDGCSADSMPCCANGSCACHCGESGCDAGDPTCCASGTCAPLPARMRFM
ncbi:uncharacterized protein BDZ99DRAFT_567487 [Mytilinidion resinicola]|uniref:Zincin n=1 Tax=Mytilinidion resinicola TaxID=574789 RepID=A0A6A6YXU2_9PEZI|nr:uncharacterized protein BDZ99DRAFT_567487 [Mytilinidion resinicola]KAF2813742.1 hypothetical protein BDZ99DRAFT_567487 [Mytilinidion resinicola]